MPTESDEKELVALARDGGPAGQRAFHTLVERHRRAIYSHCCGMLRNPDDAMDLTQETFTKAYRNLRSFEGQSSFKTWATVIATNACIDFIRKARRGSISEYEEGTRHDQATAESESFRTNPLGISPAKVLARRELVEQIEDALSELTPIHRQILLLRELEGMSYEEIAEATGVPVGTVMSRLHHARKNMRRSLASYLGGRLRVE
jgi:RNA polymerase sigma-70 factor (ECF subfamily)